MADRVLVPFAGPGSGSAGLTWGQQTIWREFEAFGTPVWLTGLKAARPGWTVEDAADELAFIMGRNQSMRTRLEVSGGRPVRQVVAGSGRTWLQVVEVAGADDPLRAARDLERRWKERDVAYDYAGDWPVRMALIRHRGAAAYFVRAVSHLVTDGYGALAMYNDILARDPVTGRAAGPVTAMEPLEQAAWQAGPAGRRCSQACERHWERLLRAIPARRFDPPPDPPGGQPGDPPGGQPGSQASGQAGAGQAGSQASGLAGADQAAGQAGARYGRLTFDSRAAYLAVQAIAARTAMASSTVLLAGMAAAVARATGINPVVPRLQVSNRFRPRLATTVSPIAQTCPCVIDVAGVSFDEAVRRAHYASLAAYKHAYFEPARIRELVAAVSQERGEQVDLAFMYNDIRMNTGRQTTAAPPAPRDVQAALPLTKIGWTDRQDLGGRCAIEFEDLPDTVNAVMVIDTQYIGQAQAEACLREMEAVMVAAAFDSGAPTGV